MSIQITINGNTYDLAQSGDSPDWGEELSAIIQALTDVSNSTVGTGDILTTAFTVGNNVSSPTLITGFAFDPSVIRSSEISYSVDRSTDTQELTENGKILVNYNSTNDVWMKTQFSNGDSGLTFTVTNGQFYYTTTNMSGSNYSGLLKFTAKAFTFTQ